MLRKLTRSSAGALLVIGLAATTAGAVPILFSPIYNDGVDEGFNDPSLGASRKFALEYAFGLIGGVFESRYAGEVIHVQAQFDPLGGTSTSAKLGTGGPAAFHSNFNNKPVANRFFPTPLANHLHLGDVNSSTYEIRVTFNTDVDNDAVLGSKNWYYGTDAKPGGHFDMVTVALHEMAHGLAFAGLLQSNGAYTSSAATIFDHFMNTSATGGIKLTELAPLDEENAARAAETKGNDLWWDGMLATMANDGTRPKLHAPATFVSGSSLYHVDEATLGSELMSPVYSGADHTFSSLELGMLGDVGWTLAAIPEPGAWLFGVVVMCLSGVAVAIQRRRENL